MKNCVNNQNLVLVKRGDRFIRLTANKIRYSSDKIIAVHPSSPDYRFLQLLANSTFGHNFKAKNNKKEL